MSTTPKILTREEILKSNDIKIELVSTPEWGGSVYVRAMTGEERDSFESLYADQRKRKTLSNFRARLAAFTLCNEKGELLFSQDDVLALGKRSAAALNRVFNKSMKLSGIGEKDVDELVKNSDGED